MVNDLSATCCSLMRAMDPAGGGAVRCPIASRPSALIVPALGRRHGTSRMAYMYARIRRAG